MEKNRKILHTILVRDKYVKDTYNDFEAFDTHYFRDAGGVDKIYSTCKKATYKKGKKEGEVIFGKDINRFYELYVCDLSWAKKTTYCGGGNTNTATWDNYPCVVELARTKGVSMNRDKSYLIGDFKYYPNGRKGIISTGGRANFTCNDPEFKKSGGGGGGSVPVTGRYRSCNDGVYTKGCKSDVVKLVQKCLGVVVDGKFWVKTQAALEAKGYPNGFKDEDINKICGTSTSDNTNTNTNTNTDSSNQTTTVNLPEWANCLKKLAKLKVSQDSNQEEIVIQPFGNDTAFFWKDMTLLYIEKDGTKLYGKWSCENNQIIINLNNGIIWTSTSGWVKSPDKTDVPDKNFDATWLPDDEYSLPNNSKVASPNKFSAENEKFKIPEFKGYDKNKPMNLNQNESTMDNLENIINEISSLIIEQTQEIVQAPKDELNILFTSPFLKNKGTLVALCRSQNGTSKPVNVNGKIYFAAKKAFKKGDTTQPPHYLTYDGLILQGSDCKYSYVLNSKGTPAQISGMAYADLDLQYTSILKSFGIDPKNYDTDPYFLIKSINNDLKKLVAQGAVSSSFNTWNDMLRYYFPENYNDYLLTPPEGKTTLNPPTNTGELAQYIPINGRKYGLNYNNKDVVILFPGNKAPVISGGENQEFTKKDCDAAITGYLAAAIRYETHQDKSDNKTINSAENREFIKGCDGSGIYKTLSIVPTDLPNVNPRNKVFNFWRGKTLNIRNVYSLLSGREKSLPAGKNPYLPFIINRGVTNESDVKLSNLIKENLQQLSEERNNKLLSETKIVQIRTKMLTENRVLKFKQSREKFFNEIITESLYFESQGFDKQLIKEEFWDILKGMFGQHGSEAIFGTFKEYMGKWLIQKLTPVNPEGWIGSIIVTAIGNLHIDDLSKLTDCNFLTKKIASSIGEGIARKIQHDKGYDGGISDIVRNGLFSAIDNTEMVKSLENGLAKLICPALSGVTKKLEDKAQKMKTMAIQA